MVGEAFNRAVGRKSKKSNRRHEEQPALRGAPGRSPWSGWCLPRCPPHKQREQQERSEVPSQTFTTIRAQQTRRSDHHQGAAAPRLPSHSNSPDTDIKVQRNIYCLKRKKTKLFTGKTIKRLSLEYGGVISLNERLQANKSRVPAAASRHLLVSRCELNEF